MLYIALVAAIGWNAWNFMVPFDPQSPWERPVSLSITLIRSATPGIECARLGEGHPLAPIASGCAIAQGRSCTIVIPDEAYGAALALSAGLTPEMIAGHEVRHCFEPDWPAL